MAKDWYATRLLITASLTGAALAFPAAATAHTHRFNLNAHSRQKLRALGYSRLHIACKHERSCEWVAVHAKRFCVGKTVLRGRRRRSVHVEGVRCATPRTVTQSNAPMLFGFNTYTTQTTVSEERAVGGSISRLFVPWWEVEPGSGSWSWSSFDAQYQQILQGGLRPLIVVYGAPCWAEASCNLAFAEPPSTSYDSAWSSYVHAVAARYPQAVGVEVWNEPNLASSFYPQVDPQRYTQLLKQAYLAVKSADPAMPVISGGIAMDDGTGTAGPGYASRTFLADIYADGAQQWMDGLGIHVYPTDTLTNGSQVWDPAALSRWLQQVTDIGQAAGVNNMPIWITEMGVSTTTEPGFPAAATEAQQSTDLVSMIDTARSDPNVRMALIDTLQDADPNLLEDLISDLTGPLINYDVFYNQLIEGLGVFHDDWTPKPAACAISATFGGALHC